MSIIPCFPFIFFIYFKGAFPISDIYGILTGYGKNCLIGAGPSSWTRVYVEMGVLLNIACTLCAHNGEVASHTCLSPFI